MKNLAPPKNPAHPGFFVKAEIIEPLGLGITEAASALGVQREAISHVLNGRSSLSLEMALRLEKAFGSLCPAASMDDLLRRQLAYDIALIRERAGEVAVEPYVSKVLPKAQGSLL